MIKTEYEFTAKSPVHTGSDENQGQIRRIRRQAVMLEKPVEYSSRFDSAENRRDAILHLFHVVLNAIFSQDLKSSRLMKIYDEFSNKLINAAHRARTKQEFLGFLLKDFGIESIKDEELAKILTLFNDVELLETIKSEYHYLILMYRAKKEQAKNENKTLSLFEAPIMEEFSADFKVTKSYVDVPFIAGNTIRGIIRDLLAYDYCQRADIKKFISKEKYHQLFAGGALTESQKNDIDAKNKIINLCPPLGLLGSAIGNQTITGALKVGHARLKCLENGTGEHEANSLVRTGFGTRRDDSKNEAELEILSNDGETHQMIFWQEEIIQGAKFDHSFRLITSNPVIESCYWHALKLWGENASVGGQSARGYGELSINLEIPEGANNLYLEHLENIKHEAVKYWGL